MKKRLFLDIETPMITGGILPNKIFLIVGKDAESKEIFSFTEDKLEDFKTLVSSYDEFVGHNIIGFDAPVINKVLAIDLHQQGKVIDTLILSRLFNPVREGGHSLKSWGDALRFDKLDFKDFSQYSDEMLTYCVRDVEVTEKVLTYLIRKYPDFSKEAIRLEHDVSRIITQQERNGFLFDMLT